jgi:DMSO reductase family type II enzyme heme b subunit
VAGLGTGPLEPEAALWGAVTGEPLVLSPSPVGLAAAVSPLMAMSQGHGRVSRVAARLAHDGSALAVQLSWEDPTQDDRIVDLDRFVDAAAVMFPLRGDTNPLTMGDETHPVNAWLWKADQSQPFDVVARGFSTSRRRPAGETGLVARADWREGRGALVFRRSLRVEAADCVAFEPGGSARIAFAVWDGANAERAGQKAVTPAFLELTLDA